MNILVNIILVLMAVYEFALVIWGVSKGVASMDLTGSSAAQGGMFLVYLILSETPLLLVGSFAFALNSFSKYQTGELTETKNIIKSLIIISLTVLPLFYVQWILNLLTFLK